MNYASVVQRLFGRVPTNLSLVSVVEAGTSEAAAIEEARNHLADFSDAPRAVARVGDRFAAVGRTHAVMMGGSSTDIARIPEEEQEKDPPASVRELTAVEKKNAREHVKHGRKVYRFGRFKPGMAVTWNGERWIVYDARARGGSRFTLMLVSPDYEKLADEVQPSELGETESADVDQSDDPFAGNAWVQASRDIAKLHAEKPSPLNRMFGKNPTDAQKAKHAELMREWSKKDREARKRLKAAKAAANESVDESKSFTPAQLAQLRDQFASVERVDPTGPAYDRMIKLLDGMSQQQLKQVAGAGIKFLSKLALNRVKQAEAVGEARVRRVLWSTKVGNDTWGAAVLGPHFFATLNGEDYDFEDGEVYDAPKAPPAAVLARLEKSRLDFDGDKQTARESVQEARFQHGDRVRIHYKNPRTDVEKAFQGKVGSISGEERDGRTRMFRVKFNPPVQVPGVDPVTSDLWTAEFLKPAGAAEAVLVRHGTLAAFVAANAPKLAALPREGTALQKLWLGEFGALSEAGDLDAEIDRVSRDLEYVRADYRSEDDPSKKRKLKARMDKLDASFEALLAKRKAGSGEEGDGKWRTTPSGHKIYIDASGKVTKGNPHVIGKAKESIDEGRGAPSWRTLADELIELSNEIDAETEVSLEVWRGNWNLQLGPGTPTKGRRASWASATIDPGLTMDDAKEVALDMLDQIKGDRQHDESVDERMAGANIAGWRIATSSTGATVRSKDSRTFHVVVDKNGELRATDGAGGEVPVSGLPGYVIRAIERMLGAEVSEARKSKHEYGVGDRVEVRGEGPGEIVRLRHDSPNAYEVRFDKGGTKVVWDNPEGAAAVGFRKITKAEGLDESMPKMATGQIWTLSTSGPAEDPDFWLFVTHVQKNGAPSGVQYDVRRKKAILSSFNGYNGKFSRQDSDAFREMTGEYDPESALRVTNTLARHGVLKLFPGIAESVDEATQLPKSQHKGKPWDEVAAIGKGSYVVKIWRGQKTKWAYSTTNPQGGGFSTTVETQNVMAVLQKALNIQDKPERVWVVVGARTPKDPFDPFEVASAFWFNTKTNLPESLVWTCDIGPASRGEPVDEARRVMQAWQVWPKGEVASQSNPNYQIAYGKTQKEAIEQARTRNPKVDPKTWNIEPANRGESVAEAKAVPPIDSPTYRDVAKLPKYNVKVSPLSAHGSDGGKLLAKRLPGWTRADHTAAALHHEEKAQEMQADHSRLLDVAARETWGRDFEPTDYRISGIGSDEFSAKHKDELRRLAHTSSAHKDAAHAHKAAAKMRSLAKEDLGESTYHLIQRDDGKFLNGMDWEDEDPGFGFRDMAVARKAASDMVIRGKLRKGKFRIVTRDTDDADESVEEGYQHVHFEGSTSARAKVRMAGGKTKSVQGRTFDGKLLVHPTGNYQWGVTHIPTGLGMVPPPGFADDREAVRFAKAASALGGWDFTDPQAVPPELAQKMSTLIASFRSSIRRTGGGSYESVDEMAKLSANGANELMRASKESVVTDDESIDWRRITRAWMDDGRVLEKRDVNFKATGDASYQKARKHSYGWKVLGRFKPGLLKDNEKLAAAMTKTRANLEAEGWSIESFTTPQ
jgi:hypothetical protein